MTTDKWGRLFITKLLNITHKQWIFRNSHIHYKKLDGMTEAQHLASFSKVRDLMYTDPRDLLPKHRYLLEEDFPQLGEGSSLMR